MDQPNGHGEGHSFRVLGQKVKIAWHAQVACKMDLSRTYETIIVLVSEYWPGQDLDERIDRMDREDGGGNDNIPPAKMWTRGKKKKNPLIKTTSSLEVRTHFDRCISVTQQKYFAFQFIRLKIGIIKTPAYPPPPSYQLVGLIR